MAPLSEATLRYEPCAGLAAALPSYDGAHPLDDLGNHRIGIMLGAPGRTRQASERRMTPSERTLRWLAWSVEPWR